MSIYNTLKKKVAVSAVTLMAGLFAFAPSVAAIPYDPNHPGLDKPGFNVYTGVPGYGNESDFLQGKEKNTSTYTDPVNSECKNGQEFAVRTYVHNGANAVHNQNGNGPGVAHGTKVKIALPGAESSKFNLSGTISASNASSVTDGLLINCGNKTMKLSYVAGSAYQYSTIGGNHKLSDSIVTTGTAIGTHSPNGNVWGCWEQRVYVFVTVKVEEVPEKPKPSLGECKLLDVKTIGGRKITYDISGTTTNAQIVGYRIDFGDGNHSTEKSGEYEYAKDGKYTLKAEVRVKYADGKEEWKSADNCMKQVVFESGKPPKVVPPTPTPTTLPVTGPAGVAAVVTAVTGMSSAAYYFVVRRRSEV